MKAVVCDNFDGIEGLREHDIPIPAPKEGELLIKVHNCGINYPDLLMITGQYQIKPTLPFSPGAEVSGTIAEVGVGVRDFEPGQTVIAAVGWGGMAEYCIAKADQTFHMRGNLRMIDGSASVVTYGTSYHALKDKAKLESDEIIAILGAAGGIGMSTIQMAKAMNARVIAITTSERKLSFVKDLGADYTIDYNTEDVREKIKEITNGNGLDVVVDPVGGKLTELLLRSLKFGGRHLIVGFASGQIPKIPLNLPLLKSCSVHGVFWTRFRHEKSNQNRENFRQIIEWLENGVIGPHIERVYSIDEYAVALKTLATGKVLGKLVLQN